MINIKKISEVSHILLETAASTFTNASVLYSYILTQHKKVSIYNSEDLNSKLSFLPWFEKCRTTPAASAEYIIKVPSDTKALYEFFIREDIKINAKMATAFYAGILQQFQAFSRDNCDGTIFAIASELIALKAEHTKCYHYLYKKEPLALFRLKAIMFQKMLLVNDAQEVEIEISDDDLKASGANIDDAFLILQESLNLVNVQKATLFKSDENRKILKTVKEN